MKVLVILVGILLILGGIMFVSYEKPIKNNLGGENMEQELYQGPVPIGYDEQHFRLTGETILVEEINNGD